ncbi:MAG: hypothetical protein Q9162_007935 [Coniocarpon cinnabarinum]
MASTQSERDALDQVLSRMKNLDMPSQLYAEATTTQMMAIERTWNHYCRMRKVNAGHELEKPNALLNLRYRDLSLFVLREPGTLATHLMLTVQLTKVKHQRVKGKAEPAFTFNVDANPFLYIVSHIIVLAIADQAFADPELDSPNKVLQLGIHDPNAHSITINWDEAKLDQPVFRFHERGADGLGISRHRIVLYSSINRWLKRLGQEAGFLKPVKTYSLRRGAGNAFNDDPAMTSAVRNLILTHSDTKVFERNYLSRHVRFDTKSVYLGEPAKHDLVRAANSMSRTIDPQRPYTLTSEEKQKGFAQQDVHDARVARDGLQNELTNLKKSKNWDKVQCCREKLERANLKLKSVVASERKALLDKIRSQHDQLKAFQDIRLQLHGAKPGHSEEMRFWWSGISFVFEQRARLARSAAAVFQSGSSVEDSERAQVLQDMCTLCGLHEARRNKSISTAPRDKADADYESEDAVEANANNFSAIPQSELPDVERPCLTSWCIFCYSEAAKNPSIRFDFKSPSNMRRHDVTWGQIYNEFQRRFPDNPRSVKALKSRYYRRQTPEDVPLREGKPHARPCLTSKFAVQPPVVSPPMTQSKPLPPPHGTIINLHPNLTLELVSYIPTMLRNEDGREDYVVDQATG